VPALEVTMVSTGIARPKFRPPSSLREQKAATPACAQ
jgi:hypothetical protein